jgi:hypothetical protein
MFSKYGIKIKNNNAAKQIHRETFFKKNPITISVPHYKHTPGSMTNNISATEFIGSENWQNC